MPYDPYAPIGPFECPNCPGEHHWPHSCPNTPEKTKKLQEIIDRIAKDKNEI